MRLTRPAFCLILAAVTAAAIGGLSASASTERAAAASPVSAVQVTVRGYYDPRYSMYTCSTEPPRHRLAAYETCPMTSRLRRLLNHPPYRAGGLPFSRSQSAPRTVRVWQRSSNGRTVYVNAQWDFGAQSFITTFVVEHRGSAWLIDDEYCAGHPSTSIYRGHQPCR